MSSEKSSDTILTTMESLDIELAVRNAGLALKKTGDTPANSGVSPALALARALGHRRRNQSPELLGIDAPSVSRDVATELVAHHLGLAAAYFEATPEDSGPTIAEVDRILALPDKHIPNHVSPSRVAARAFMDAIARHYEKMERDNDC